ncbi:flocculation protein FLO11-like [Stegodyphus dumicola]|uniref:flocculation protein FLO11-like n=1 Tax=Stegodyphus dumicola TaxID=202533 RepID=UPI0015A9B473|nr:flocculation protein FLO11-like [Stegodyphus dumicola]
MNLSVYSYVLNAKAPVVAAWQWTVCCDEPSIFGKNCYLAFRTSFLIIITVKPQLMNATAEDLFSSGDGDVSIHSAATLIDEAGEINEDSSSPSLLNIETSSDNSSNLDNDDSSYQTTVTVTETSLEMTTKASAVTTTEPPAITTERTTMTTFLPTTEEETTSTYTTTVTSQPTTTIRSTTMEIPVTTTQGPATTTKQPLPSTATKSVEQKLTTIATHPVPTVETSTADGQEKCSFTDESLVCDFELICYGEGEIDCSSENGAMLPEFLLVTRSSSPSASSSEGTDYEYENEEFGTIGLFPSDLVGRVSPKKRLPFLFKMGMLTTPLAPTMNSDDFTTDILLETADDVNSEKAEIIGGETSHEKKTSAATITTIVSDSIVESVAKKAWGEVSRRTLNSAWRKLWAAVVAERDFEGFEIPTEEEAVDDPAPLEEIISLSVFGACCR